MFLWFHFSQYVAKSVKMVVDYDKQYENNSKSLNESFF